MNRTKDLVQDLLDFVPVVGPLLNKGIDLLTEDEKQKVQEFNAKLTALQAQNLAQAQINANEALHKSVYVAGWRPFIGWVCGASLVFSEIIVPYIFPFFIEYVPTLASVNPVNENFWELIVGMLGIAGLRSYEKKIGKA